MLFVAGRLSTSNHQSLRIIYLLISNTRLCCFDGRLLLGLHCPLVCTDANPSKLGMRELYEIHLIESRVILTTKFNIFHKRKIISSTMYLEITSPTRGNIACLIALNYKFVSGLHTSLS